MSWYLTIRLDERYSQFTDTARLLEVLRGLFELEQTGDMTFGSVEPWVSVRLLVCDSSGNYSYMQPSPPFVSQVNMVELVCAYTADPAWCERLALHIAGVLAWEGVEDSEERRLSSPS